MSLTTRVAFLAAVIAAMACAGGTDTVTPTGPPRITTIAPIRGPLAGGGALTIEGSGFAGMPSVTIGDRVATAVVVSGSTRITAIIPAGIAGLASVVVTNADGQRDTLVDAYAYVPAPSISSVTPGDGQDVGSSRVIVSGEGFETGATVSFGGDTALWVTVNGSTSITAFTPEHAPGVVTVTVTNPDKQSGQLASGFTFNAYRDLRITSVTPNTGSTAGGMFVDIVGAGFFDPIAVQFGELRASDVTFISSTRLRVTVPPRGIGGPVFVRVFAPWDFDEASLMNGFTYVPPQ